MAERPERPKSEDPVVMGFTRVNKMTPWLSPSQLFRTALHVVLSAVFGSYSDKREVQAGLPKDLPPKDYSCQPELWVDFVSDLGDGFGPTYTIATLLAAESLELESPQGTPAVTNRGRVLVMGGDEVYPTASVREYQNKTVGPYASALPWVEEEEAPHLYVIPGNHDWYDGLTSFMRVFCGNQWIGGWKTQQSRSYFALKLPNRWWLWGIDIQFDSYIDGPQFRYFQEVADDMKPGDSVILCTAKPSWAKAAEEGEQEAYATLDYLDRKLVRRKGAEIRLALTGDLHHYARYAQVDEHSGNGTRPAQKITAGGGGAFLAATHHLPSDLELPPSQSLDRSKSTPPTRWKLQRTYPSARESRRLRWNVVRLPLDNAGMWGFVGGVHVAYGWMAQAAHRTADERFHEVVSRLSFDDIVWGIARSPLAVLVTAGLVRGLVGFTKAHRPTHKWGLGLAHSAAQLGAVVLSVGTAAGICGALGLSGLGFSAGFVILAGVGGGLLGCWVMAGYLLVADRFELNDNELYSAQRNRDWKNFLRLHLAEDGTVTVYPVGVAKTPRKWRLRRGGDADAPWFEPVDRPVVAQLIEEPIRVGPAAAAAPGTAPAGAVTAGNAPDQVERTQPWSPPPHRPNRLASPGDTHVDQ